nr:sulfite exporter TauE/SafE family protein [uncultured Desulfuromonas sp.]
MTDLAWWQLVALASVGVVSGFLNILAGGGSLLTLPLLIFLGLPPTMANGTNRVAIVVQNVFALRSFHQSGVLSWRLALLCSLPAIGGALIGAQLAVVINEALFKQVLAGVMVMVLLLTTFDPAQRYQGCFAKHPHWRQALLLIGFFGVGFYGGFIQAGVGFLILSVALMVGLDLVQGNVLKVVVVLILNLPALAIFALNGQVDWLLGSVLAVGNACGGAMAARLAVLKGHHWLKRVVTLVVLLCAVRLFLA